MKCRPPGLALLLVLSMAVTLFAGCGGQEEDTTPEETTTAEEMEETTTEEATEGEDAADESKVLKWNLASAGPATIDPTMNGASDGGDVINQMYEALTREKSGVVYPGIAESWDISEDGLTVTFNLRESKCLTVLT